MNRRKNKIIHKRGMIKGTLSKKGKVVYRSTRAKSSGIIDPTFPGIAKKDKLKSRKNFVYSKGNKSNGRGKGRNIETTK